MLEKTEGTISIDNSETMATLGTQDTGWRWTKNNVEN